MGANIFFGNFERFLKHRRTNALNIRENNATLELLKSSVLVAFSGFLRVHIAFLLLKLQPNLLTCVAGGLVIYAVYTIDRALGSEEDSVNRKELDGSRKEVGLVVSLLTFLMGSYVFAKEGMLVFAFIPFITGYLYSKGIKIGKYSLRLKGRLGVKNLVVGLTWGACIAGLAGGNSGSIIPVILVFIFFGAKLFVNSTIYDFKDIKGDTLAGIKTLPVSLGEKSTRNLLTGIHLISHLILGIAIIYKVLPFEPVIILSSLILGLLCIQNYTKCIDGEFPHQKLGRIALVDGESTSILGIRMIASTLLG
jgi:4-hydroxybenzoate polyprenyltransferase